MSYDRDRAAREDRKRRTSGPDVSRVLRSDTSAYTVFTRRRRAVRWRHRRNPAGPATSHFAAFGESEEVRPCGKSQVRPMGPLLTRPGKIDVSPKTVGLRSHLFPRSAGTQIGPREICQGPKLGRLLPSQIGRSSVGLHSPLGHLDPSPLMTIFGSCHAFAMNRLAHPTWLLPSQIARSSVGLHSPLGHLDPSPLMTFFGSCHAFAINRLAHPTWLLPSQIVSVRRCWFDRGACRSTAGWALLSAAC